MMDQPILNREAERIDYRFAAGTQSNRREDVLVLLGHGVTGNKDRPILVETANALNGAGFDTLRFSFSGNGDSEGRFEEATVSKEAADLDAILGAVSREYPRIAYVGHSMSLAGMVDTRTFAQTEFGDLVPGQDCMWEEEAYPLSRAFMTDLCETVRSVEPQAGWIAVPWLLVHGTGDDVVLPRDSELVKEQLGQRVDLVLVEGANHVFSEPQHMKRATTAVVDWLARKA